MSKVGFLVPGAISTFPMTRRLKHKTGGYYILDEVTDSEFPGSVEMGQFLGTMIGILVESSLFHSRGW